MNTIIEEKKNNLNFELRVLLSVIDLIDEQKKDYPDYVPGQLSDEEFFDEQIKLIKEAKERLINIFKD